MSEIPGEANLQASRERGGAVRVLIRYSPGPLTAKQYEETLVRVQAVGGEWPPDGLEYHVCFGPDGALQVIEVWSSRAKLDAFRQWFTPLVSHVGVDVGKWEVFEVHHVVRRGAASGSVGKRVSPAA
jgi:hypothetical protein